MSLWSFAGDWYHHADKFGKNAERGCSF